MTRSTTIVTLALLSSILTPVVVKATDTAQGRSAVVQQAKVETAAVRTETPAIAATPACARKVKVVYGGFGEVHAAACAVTAEMAR
jgi:hypothetical protein